MVIAVDGPGGVGKSTVSRGVASKLGVAYLDTGSTYRAATLAVIRADVDPADAEAVLTTVLAVDIDYDDRGVLLGGEPVAADVRSGKVTRDVSAVSAHPAVRAHIVELQRSWVERRDGEAVVEGRDIGTVVFPEAPVKVFLTARSEVRALRRAGDAEAIGASITDIERDLERRDTADSSRSASPMRAADDAVVIDTSDLSADEVIAEVLGLVEAARSDSEE